MSSGIVVCPWCKGDVVINGLAVGMDGGPIMQLHREAERDETGMFRYCPGSCRTVASFESEPQVSRGSVRQGEKLT